MAKQVLQDVIGTDASPGLVREMRPEEKREVHRLMRRSFNWFTSLFFDFGSKAYVYALDGAIVAGITLSVFPIGGGMGAFRRRRASRRGGVVKWVFTAPEARGCGAAGELVDAALKWFDHQECTKVFACIEGHNTGSSNIFARRGFEPLPFSRQVREYRWSLPRVWLDTFHLIDVGHFLWARGAFGTAPAVPGAPADADGVEPADGGVPASLITVVMQAIALVFLASRWGWTDDVLTLAWQATVAVALVIGMRLAAMALTARAFDWRLSYRPWETGLLLSFVLGATGLGILPAPGSLYPRTRAWSYSRELGRFGPVAYAGALAVLVTGWILHLVTGAGPTQAVTINLRLLPVGPAARDLISGSLRLGLVYARILLIFEVLLPFFPFTCFNGRRVMDWRRPSMGVLVVGTLLLWAAAYLV